MIRSRRYGDCAVGTKSGCASTDCRLWPPISTRRHPAQAFTAHADVSSGCAVFCSSLRTCHCRKGPTHAAQRPLAHCCSGALAGQRRAEALLAAAAKLDDRSKGGRLLLQLAERSSRGQRSQHPRLKRVSPPHARRGARGKQCCIPLEIDQAGCGICCGCFLKLLPQGAAAACNENSRLKTPEDARRPKAGDPSPSPSGIARQGVARVATVHPHEARGIARGVG